LETLMADTIECPACRRRLQVPAQSIGMEVACPRCGQIFRAALDQQAPAATPSFLGGAVPASEPRTDSIFPDPFAPPEPGIGSIDDWRKVRTGITLIFAGTLISITLVLFAVCAGFFAALAAAGSGAEPESALAGLALVVGVFMFAGLLNRVLECAGRVFCVWAPAEHGARRWAIACLALLIVGFGLQLLGGVVGIVQLGAARSLPGADLSETTENLGSIASSVGQVVELVNVLVFLFYLRAVARCIEDQKLHDNVKQLLILASAAVVLTIGLLAAIFVAMAHDDTAMIRNMGIVGIGAACTVLVLFVAAFVWFMVVLWQARTALTWYIHRRGGD
jgi:hypothetical protein